MEKHLFVYTGIKVSPQPRAVLQEIIISLREQGGCRGLEGQIKADDWLWPPLEPKTQRKRGKKKQ